MKTFEETIKRDQNRSIKSCLMTWWWWNKIKLLYVTDLQLLLPCEVCIYVNLLPCTKKTADVMVVFALHINWSFWKVSSYIHSTSTWRMRWFLAVLGSFFHSSLLCTFSCHSSPPTILPSSLHLAICFLVYCSIFFPNSYIIPFWEFYFLPFSVHAQTNVIYLTWLSLL